MKNTLIILDDKDVKIVFGSMIKCFKINEISRHKPFIDKIYDETNVFVLESVSRIDKETLLQSIDQKNTQNIVGENSENSEQDDVEVVAPVKSIVKKQIPVSNNKNDGTFFVRSTAPSAIMIDDLLSNQEIKGLDGVRQAVAIPYGLAVDLSVYDQEDLNKSKILKRLLENGTLVRVSTSQALQLEKEYARKHEEEEAARSIIIDRSVSDFVNGRDADSVDITEDVVEERPRRRANTSLTDLVENGDYGMSDLMDIANTEETVEDLDENPKPKSQIMQRQRSAGITSGIEPRGIKRRD